MDFERGNGHQQQETSQPSNRLRMREFASSVINRKSFPFLVGMFLVSGPIVAATQEIGRVYGPIAQAVFFLAALVAYEKVGFFIANRIDRNQ